MKIVPEVMELIGFLFWEEEERNEIKKMCREKGRMYAHSSDSAIPLETLGLEPKYWLPVECFITSKKLQRELKSLTAWTAKLN